MEINRLCTVMKKKAIFLRSNKKGFTLLEMVVSISIVALVAVVLSQIFIVTLRTNAKTEISKDMKQNGELALESMVRMIQRAKSIATTCASSGTTVQSLTIVNNDDGETTYGCVADGTAMRLASSSASATKYLTSSNVTLGGTTCSESTLEFVCYGAAGLPGSVTISFQLSHSGMSFVSFEQSSESFQTTATMRNNAN